MAAMSDMPVAPTSESIHTHLIVLLDPKMWGVAVGISVLFYTQAEI